MFTIPNILTFFRILAIPGMVAGFYLPGDWQYWLPFGLFVAAAVTDFFDGYLARALDQMSELGRLLDPIADKLLVGTALIMLVGEGIIGGVGVIAAAIILIREILVSGLREFLAGAQVSVPVTQLAKWKTTVQMIALSILLTGPAGDAIIPFLTELGMLGLWVAAILTIVTGYGYLKQGLAHVIAVDRARAGD
ncbi:MAG: CDP-diacylglycerol--glycerol-3-phosphate 3-phosphatidyltransferase [Alphaproteobacteria bacterium]